ncbi:Hypothetical protein NTJ_08069 [Nesidiocoris tenuis]|uniref:Uncharacterized protein n=1 Tax=Nesidiocoris tenuis TaxID=355587 RepID=A0ABN7ASS9_9HEMI|nr:Hypothetical protein NTJ_08069 [Nesidiocoris tenuis]
MKKPEKGRKRENWLAGIARRICLEASAGSLDAIVPFFEPSTENQGFFWVAITYCLEHHGLARHVSAEVSDSLEGSRPSLYVAKKSIPKEEIPFKQLDYLLWK